MLLLLLFCIRDVSPHHFEAEVANCKEYDGNQYDRTNYPQNQMLDAPNNESWPHFLFCEFTSSIHIPQLVVGSRKLSLYHTVRRNIQHLALAQQLFEVGFIHFANQHIVLLN